jgi:hypothetical protein
MHENETEKGKRKEKNFQINFFKIKIKSIQFIVPLFVI